MKLSTLLSLVSLQVKNQVKVKLRLKYTPFKWLIQLTNDCNSRCQTCHIWKINKENPTFKEQETNLDEYRKLFEQSGGGLHWLALSGGEISLFEPWDDFIELIRKNCPSLKLVTFTTNGLEPKKILARAQSLKKISREVFIVLSLDGPQKLHDKLRGVPGNYEKVFKTKALLDDEGIATYLGATLNNQNIDYWQSSYTGDVESISLVHSDGIYHKSVRRNEGVIFEGLKKILRKYQLNSIAKFGEFIYLRLALSFLKTGKTPLPCDSLNSSIHFDPYGKVQACMFMPSLGSIKDNSLGEILGARESERQRKLIKNKNCPQCWMNCYAPHSIMAHPFKSSWRFIESYFI
jgi:MoaA/NifB/PqqE/SkfB family radical SAM enzyme